MQSRPNQLGELVQQAYRDFTSGRYQAAERNYTRALNLSPSNRDALLGLSAISADESRWQDDLKFYQIRLNDDPADEYARSGILSLAQTEENNQELLREVEALLVEHPELGHLHFLKGSFLASSAQWSGAQVLFFKPTI